MTERSFSVRSVIARYPVVAFLVMAYGITLLVGLWPALTRRDVLPFDQSPYDWLAHFLGSALPAFVVVWAVSGRTGVRDFFARCTRWRVALRWYAIALLGVPVATLLVASFFYGAEPVRLLARDWGVLFTTVLPHLLLVIVFSNVAEEVGWTGFLLDRMQGRYKPMRAAIITGIAFAFAHVPSYAVEEGWAAVPILFGFLLIPQVASRFIVAWIYNSTKRSVLLVGLFHCSFNVTSAEFSRAYIPGPRDELLFFSTLVILVGTVVIAIMTRGRLGRSL